MLIDPRTNSLLLRLRQPELVNKVLPHWSRNIDIDGHNMVVKFDLEVVQVLRNMGIKAPSPIRYHYHWPRPPKFSSIFNHQYATEEFCTLHQRLFVLNEMGTSKTASALWAADYLMSKGFVGKAIIVSPLSTLELVWANEIFQVLMHRTCAVLHGTRAKRFELLAKPYDFYIINHDGLAIIADELAKRKDVNLIIVDEAAAYRNARTERYKVLENLLQHWHRLWLLTGTPCPTAPTDAWALTRLVNPSRVPKFFGAWKRDTMMQMSTHRWLPRPGSHEMAYHAMQPAVRFKKSECLDLPPVTFEDRTCALTPEQTKIAAKMRSDAAAEIAAGVPVTAVNAADKINKLRQIMCGVVKDPATDTYHEVPHAPRVQTLIETIECAAAKVLVIVPFKGIVHSLKRDLASRWECEVVNGDVTPAQRTAIFQRFRSDANLKVLLCHPRVMAHGITATEADMVIFYAPIYSNEESQQVMERINRPGQTRKMTIVRISASPLERSIYAKVEEQRIGQDTILEMYKREMEVI